LVKNKGWGCKLMALLLPVENKKKKSMQKGNLFLHALLFAYINVAS
jgi:hypothetical protein